MAPVSTAPLLAPSLSSSRPGPQPQHVRASLHFRTLLGKNALLKRREWSATCCPWCPFAACCELVLPLAVLALLWWAKVQCNEGDGGQCQLPILEGWGGTMPKDSHATICSEGLPLNTGQDGPVGYSTCRAWSEGSLFERPRPFVDVLAYLHWSGKRLALAVQDPSDRPKVENLREWITTNWHPDMNMTNIPCIDLETDIFRALKSSRRRRGHGPPVPGRDDNSTLPCKPGKQHPGLLPGFSKLTEPKIFTADELQSHLDSPTYGADGLLYGAVVFDAIGGDGTLGASGRWSYSIRLNVTAKTAPFTGMPKTRPLDPGLRMGEASTYMNNGFVSLQLLLNRYIIGNRSSISDTDALLRANRIRLPHNETPEVADRLAESCRYAPQSVETLPMPVAGVVIDGFYELVSVAFPLVFIVAFLYTQKKVINELITEKETKVRESLRMMGVGSAAIIGSWYVTYAVIFGVLCIVFTAVARVQIFRLSSSILIFALFWLWCMSFLSFALFMHSFFNHSRTGGIVGMMVMFAQWIVYGSQNKSGPPSESVALLLNFMPNAAFSAGLDIVAKYEAAKVGATWQNLTWPVSNSSFALVLGMMCFDIVVWTALGWYLDRVLPKEFGTRLPPHFLCLPSYWRGQSSQVTTAATATAQAVEEGEAGMDVPARAVGHDTVEGVPEAVQARSQASGIMVRTLALRREFSTPGGTKVAVAGLDLTMYEGQILALLGHNGAGKTTTIHMLTGLVEPSAGDAHVLGYSVLTGMGNIRRVIGVCPQHDVLWLELTVLEHLRAYARLRGIAVDEVDQRANELMQEVGLTEKAATRAGSLSGGQKRKLSLCLALVGRPRIVFLDEPTSGMDPFSRRSTWNVIRGVRDGRVTVLTTHFMDEADILGDRIAILADGVLQCCGASLFLKNRFGAGYRITCARKKEGLAGLAAGRADEAVAMIVRKHVPEAELLTDVGAELSLRLPTTAVGCFPALFHELDTRLDELKLEHYGLSMVTLEEVFLRVASGEMACLAGSTQPTSAVEAGRQGSGAEPPAGTGAASTEAGSQSCGAAPVATTHAAAATAAAAAVETGTRNRHWYKEARIMLRHTGSLFMKRARYGRRDFKSVGCTVLLPVAMLAFGLWLLQKVSDRHLPAVGLGVVEQFGRSIDLPYDTPGGEAWVGMASHFGAKPVALQPPPADDHSLIFGREYVAGLPVYKKCEEHTLPLPTSKCFRQNHFCPVELILLLSGVQEAGLQIGCQSTCTDTAAAISAACADGAVQCVENCVYRAQGLSRSLCRQQCAQICALVTNITVACAFVPAQVTIGWLCPVPCASENNPDTCAPNTVCKPPPDPHAANASGLLGLEMLLFRQGQGLTREQVRYGAVLTTMKESIGSTVTLLHNTSGVHAVPTFFNLVSSALKEAQSGSGSSISASSYPMPVTTSELVDKVVSAVVNLLSTFVIIIAFSWIPAAIVAYVVREREAHHNSKHQQLISGVSLIAYWTANLLWDLCVYAAPLSLSMLFMDIFGIHAFIRNGALWASFLTFLGYGLAIAPASYLLSFLFSKHTTAQILCLVINFITGLILMIASYILSAIDNTKDVNRALMWLYRIFPGFCLGHGLFQICTNSLAASQLGMEDEIDLLGWDVAGPDVAFLFLAAPTYFVLAVLADYLLHSPLAAASKHFDPRIDGSAGQEEEEEEDPDVASEAARVAGGAADDDVIRIVGLRKVYRTPEGTPKVAVKGLSFGLPRGECFGFLGINGAGKTSTLNMLTGAVLPSGGTAYLGGHDIVMEQWKVRRLLGYCPQHDALLDRLTVREHLELFGRIKGLSRTVLRGYCDSIMEELSLAGHVDKLAMTLSGGNKRKLSLAIALMGSPPLVLLDEPSTGVDPAARRLMWDAISAISTARKECSVMLTTHNMEEAEALCSRIGIMVGGRLRCIGSNQHLKARFGTGYQMEARLACPTAAEVAKAAVAWALPEQISPEQMLPLCIKLGSEARASLLQGGCEEGYAIVEALQREGSVAARAFAEWWLLEDRTDGLGDWLRRSFPGTLKLERHDRTLRFRLPTGSPLSEVFRLLEAARAELALEEYGISQTSLEQIFNEFAARQQEETQAVRGLFAAARTVVSGADASRVVELGAVSGPA